MAGEKKFRTGMGYNKDDVNEFLERIMTEFDGRLKGKDDEIASLKQQLRDSRAKCDSLSADTVTAAKERDMIARALIQAQEKAESVIEAARAEALAEKDKLEKLLESERERLIDIKRDIRQLKDQVAEVTARFKGQLDDAEALVATQIAKYEADDATEGIV